LVEFGVEAGFGPFETAKLDDVSSPDDWVGGEILVPDLEIAVGRKDRSPVVGESHKLLVGEDDVISVADELGGGVDGGHPDREGGVDWVAADVNDPRVRQSEVKGTQDLEVCRVLIDHMRYARRRGREQPKVLAGTGSKLRRIDRAARVIKHRLAVERPIVQLAGSGNLRVAREDLLGEGGARAHHAHDNDWSRAVRTRVPPGRYPFA